MQIHSPNADLERTLPSDAFPEEDTVPSPDCETVEGSYSDMVEELTDSNGTKSPRASEGDPVSSEIQYTHGAVRAYFPSPSEHSSQIVTLQTKSGKMVHYVHCTDRRRWKGGVMRTKHALQFGNDKPAHEEQKISPEVLSSNASKHGAFAPIKQFCTFCTRRVASLLW